MLSQLQSILKKNKMNLPVKVEIDGTGYLKDCSTGMYILDQYDNGFELSREEINLLKNKGFISMWFFVFFFIFFHIIMNVDCICW